MSYRITDNNLGALDCTELVNPGIARKAIAIILSAIGMAVAAFGIWMWIEKMHMPIPGIVLFFGGLLLGIGVLLSNFAAIPHRFVFDNRHGELRVLQKASDSDDMAAIVSYNEIAGFYVSRKTSTSSSESNRTVVRYAVAMHKYDGFSWQFDEFSNSDRAQQMCDQLRAKIDLAAQPRDTPKASDYRFDIFESRHETTIHWRKGINLATLCGSSIIIATGLAFAYAVVPHFTGTDTARYAIFALSGLLAVIPVFSALSSLSTKNTVTINNNELSFSPKGGFWQKSFSIPLTQIVAIGFDFSPSELSSMIAVRREDEMRQIVEILSSRPPGFLELFSLLRLVANMTFITCGNITMTQRIHLEQLIQDALKKHGHQTSDEQRQLLKKFLRVAPMLKQKQSDFTGEDLHQAMAEEDEQDYL